MRMCACRGTAGFAHVSCLAEQAKILVAEVEENNLGNKVLGEIFARWYTCGLCEQDYHGVVRCALGWACWKTYVGAEEDEGRIDAMNQLGNGLYHAGHYEDALIVREALLALNRRIGASKEDILALQSNLATTYANNGMFEEGLRLRRGVYTETMKLLGKEANATFIEANNYSSSLVCLKRFEEAKALLRKTNPVARRVIGASHELTLRMGWTYALALYKDDSATLADLSEAATMLEDMERIARRVLGGAHPLAQNYEYDLRKARAVLRARETPSPGSS